MEYQKYDKEHLPDTEYKEIVGEKIYPEAYTYEGHAEHLRVEFVAPLDVPVPFGLVRRAVEVKLKLQGYTPLKMELRKGPETKGFAKIPQRLYKLDVYVHGSPLNPLIAAVIAALAIGIPLTIIAIRADPVVWKNFSGFFAGLPNAIKWMAIASIIGVIAARRKS